MNEHLREDQSNKSQSGQNFKQEIEVVLNKLIETGVLKSYDKQKNFNHVGYSYEKQYLANYILRTHNDQYIVVNGSNTFRSDRVKSAYYDFIGIMQSWDNAKDAIAYICVFGEKEKDTKAFNNERERFRTGEAYSPATHFFTLSQFKLFLEEYNSAELTTIEDEKERLSDADRGSYYGKSGNEFERELVAELQSPKTFVEYTENKKDSNDLIKMILDKIMSDGGIKVADLDHIEATNKIPQLLSGGNPKTDIKIDLHLLGNQVYSQTLSLKRTNKKEVSCHDYTYDRFSKVLGCEGEKLEKYFETFQLNPSYDRFKAALAEMEGDYSFEDFKTILTPKSRTFNEWVLTGKHDTENILFPTEQISNYILINTKDKTLLYSMEEYIDLLEEQLKTSSRFHFGVPFVWTRPSKQDGKRIQLKVPVISK